MEDSETRKELTGLIGISIATIAIVVIILVSGILLFKSNLTFEYRAVDVAFPVYEEGQLSATRSEIIKIVQQEYRNPRNALEYSDSIEEPWCADFVSWVYNSAGHKFKNPNSGGWRIPGVNTLKEYFEAENRWHDKDSGSIPEPGDVIIYNGGIFGQHTNIVVSVYYDELTTVGGNENGKIMMHKVDYNDGRYGIVGYGSAE
jgi:hypothetical protein